MLSIRKKHNDYHLDAEQDDIYCLSEGKGCNFENLNEENELMSEWHLPHKNFKRNGGKG